MDEFNWDQIVELSDSTDFELEDQVIEDIDSEEKVDEVEVKDDSKADDSIVETEEEVIAKDDEAPGVNEEPVETESYKLLQLLIDTGQIEDSVVEIDGNEIQLSNFKDLDKDTLKDIIDTFKNTEKEKINKDYVSIKDLDDNRKNLIDIILKGDLEQVKEVLKDSEDVIKDPFEKFDNTNDEHNAQVYYAYLVNQKGNTEDEAKALIDVAFKNKSLDLKALKIVEAYRENSKKILEEKKEKVLKEAEEKKNKIKEYSKTLDNTFKTYDLKPEKVLEFKKLATQYDSEGNLPIDKIYEEYISDPEKAADLILFLSDKELYNKRIFAQAQKSTLKDTVNKIQIVKQVKKAKNEEPEDKPVLDGTSFLESLVIE